MNQSAATRDNRSPSNSRAAVPSAPRRGPRRWRLVTAALVGAIALTLGGGAVPVPHDTACGRVSAILEPSCGAWLGIWPRTRADGTLTTDLFGNLASLEQRLGRQFDIVSRYYGWGQMLPDDWDRRWYAGRRLLLLDLRARNFATGEYASWRSIAAGRHDAYLTRLGHRLRDLGGKVFFSFNQEPEQELEKGTHIAGTPEDFVAAYRHIHDVFTRAGATNVVWVWWIMGYLGHTHWYPRLYPGDRYVDWISYDPYDFNTCRNVPPKTPEQTVLPFLRWLEGSGLGAGKPVMLSEFGSHGVNRQQWLVGFAEVIKRSPRIKAIVSFNSNPGGCDTRVTNSPDTWQGFVRIAYDPYFRQPIAPAFRLTATPA